MCMTDEPSALLRSAEMEPRKSPTPAAQRALAEAEARRAAQTDASAWAKEVLGPKGPEPTRFGDWERNGIASDF
jgi:hypothetical protein